MTRPNRSEVAGKITDSNLPRPSARPRDAVVSSGLYGHSAGSKTRHVDVEVNQHGRLKHISRPDTWDPEFRTVAEASACKPPLRHKKAGMFNDEARVALEQKNRNPPALFRGKPIELIDQPAQVGTRMTGHVEVPSVGHLLPKQPRSRSKEERVELIKERTSEIGAEKRRSMAGLHTSESQHSDHFLSRQYLTTKQGVNLTSIGGVSPKENHHLLDEADAIKFNDKRAAGAETARCFAGGPKRSLSKDPVKNPWAASCYEARKILRPEHGLHEIHRDPLNHHTDEKRDKVESHVARAKPGSGTSFNVHTLEPKSLAPLGQGAHGVQGFGDFKWAQGKYSDDVKRALGDNRPEEHRKFFRISSLIPRKEVRKNVSSAGPNGWGPYKNRVGELFGFQARSHSEEDHMNFGHGRRSAEEVVDQTNLQQSQSGNTKSKFNLILDDPLHKTDRQRYREHVNQPDLPTRSCSPNHLKSRQQKHLGHSAYTKLGRKWGKQIGEHGVDRRFITGVIAKDDTGLSTKRRAPTETRAPPIRNEIYSSPRAQIFRALELLRTGLISLHPFGLRPCSASGEQHPRRNLGCSARSWGLLSLILKNIFFGWRKTCGGGWTGGLVLFPYRKRGSRTCVGGHRFLGGKERLD